MRVNLQAHDDSGGGYGRFGVETTRSLKRMGVVDLGDVGHGATNEADLDHGPTYINEPQGIAGEALWLSTPPALRGRFTEQHTSIFTMWESTIMPAGFRENLHIADTVFVPSVQNQELFSNFFPDVRYIPLGVNPDVWGYRPRAEVRSDFNFLTAGYGPRKNCIEVARAFNKVFAGKPIGNGPVPRLYVRSRDDLDFPNVYSISSKLTDIEEVSLYAQAHCFVSGSRGEGWGLMPSQAIAQGCPTILGNAHGHAAFAHLGISLETTPISAARATFWGDGGEWWEPDFDQMCEAMRDVYSSYDQYLEQARQSSKLFLNEFTWDRTAEKLVFELFPHMDAPARPCSTGAWEPVTAYKFHLRVNTTCTYAINGQARTYVPGVDYYVIADLKRQILQNGQCDLSVFDPHEFGIPAAQADDLMRANSRCPACHQRYGLDLTPAESVDQELACL